MKRRPEGDQRRARQVLDALRRVQDPELRKDLVSLGFIDTVSVADGFVSFRLTLTTPACPMRDLLRRQCEEAVRSLPWVKGVSIEVGARVPGRPASRDLLPGVCNIIAVGSGKGGVGKTTVAVNLALSLAGQGAQVGLLDADIYGPNVPRMLGLSEQPAVEQGKIVPLTRQGLRVMSMGLLTEAATPVIWRGPLVTKAVQQFLGDVAWGELDYLFVDLPPGTGDVQLTLAQTVTLTGAVLVTTPQPVALDDTLRGLEMFRRVNVPVLGMIENMSYFLCPHCGKETDIFGRGAVRQACERLGIEFLGEIPVSGAIREGSDSGRPVALLCGPEAERFREIASRVAAQVSVAAWRASPGGARG